MRLKDLHEKLEGRTAVFTFGRMNPPTIGHEKLLNKLKNVASRSSADWFVYLSSSQDAKKNPLPFERKIHYAKKMFGRDVNARTFPKEPTALHAASSLYSKGYKKLIMVVGSDRVNDFSKLLKQYNNQDKPHGFYNFDSIDVVSAGDRDPDAEGISGMSASKLRGFAVQGKFDEFAKGLPGLNDKDAKSLFNEIRKGLKLQALSEKIKVQKEIIPEKVTMKSSTFKDIFKREDIDEDIMDVLKKKAEVSGISLQILKSIYEKAIKQYKLGHEIGQVKEQYAMQKVNTHLLEHKNIDDTDEQFKEWMKMNEATDVVVSTPTGRYQTKTDSLARTKQKEKMRFRSSADRNRVTVKRATPRDKRFTDREPVQESLDEATANELKKYMKSKWNTDVRASKVGTGKSMRVIGTIPNDFRDHVAKQFYPDAKILDKKNIDFGNIRPNYVSLRVGMWDELLKEDIQEKAVSKQQQKFFGLVRAIQKGEASGSPEAEKAAQDMSKKDVKDFAGTKHKGLPKKVQSESDLVKRIKGLRKKSMNEDNDLKKVAKELKNASKMHMAQSKRVEKHLSKMKEEYDFDANTLLQQLGGGKFIAMTGAKNLMVDQKEKSLHMRIGKNSKGINHVKITLMPDDTYKMDFGRIRKLDYKVVRSVTGVYAEALRDVFTEVTGLYTSL